MSVPVIALVGRPNVGKSTLFNRLTQSMQALVGDMPGVTRDRQFGQGAFEEKPYIVIDTGGFIESPDGVLETEASKQSDLAIQECDIIFFVVDAREGLTASDRQLAKRFRKHTKPLFLVVNKTDGLNSSIALGDFYQLGFENIFAVAAAQNAGIAPLMERMFETLPDVTSTVVMPDEEAPKVAVIGRPNVGKSTLINRLLGEERVIVCDYPGTTRDSIYLPLERRGKLYTLIDTAGVRRKSKITESLEKFSIVKTLQAIKTADVVLFLIDARDGVTDQDLTLIAFILEAGPGLVICVNKWDGLDDDDRKALKSQLEYRLRFVAYAPIQFMSALHGTGVGDLYKYIDKIYACQMKEVSSHQLTEILNSALFSHQPPMVQGRRIKLRYAHLGGRKPFTIIIHGNQTANLPKSYQRYLSNYYMKSLKLKGIPLNIVCKSGDNPYAGKKNTLTPRQIHKKRRLMDFVKKQKKKK